MLTHDPTSESAPAVDSAGRPLRLVCAEAWGGNRSISTPVELPGMHGYLHTSPSTGGRGGDVHCLSICDSGLTARLCVADVVGHGDEVAAVSAEIHRLLRRHLNTFDQRRLLRKLNRRFVDGGFGAMTTAVMATYFPPTRGLSISYAGHPRAWLWQRARAAWSVLEPARVDAAPGVLVDGPLAVEPGTVFTRRRLRVALGDRLLLLTDGVLETADPAGELFGTQRLAALLAELGDAPPRTVVQAVLEGLERFAGGPLQHDDVTLLVLEFDRGPRWPLWEIVRNRILRPRGNSGDPEFALR